MWELDVICLPTNIPHHLEADVTNLGVHDSIHVKDLVLPQGVRTKHDPESVVITVAGSMREEIAAAAPAEGEAAAAGSEPEVLKEKKKEEGDDAAAGKAGAKPPELPRRPMAPRRTIEASTKVRIEPKSRDRNEKIDRRPWESRAAI